jgi:hypothetical protein
MRSLLASVFLGVFAVFAVPAEAGKRLLVLEPTSDAADATAARTIGNLVVVELSRESLLDVLTRGDVARLMELNGDRQGVGCQVESCLAELAGALGAQHVVYGDLGRLGSNYVLNLSLFDTTTARAMSRVAVQGTLDDLGPRVPVAARELIAPLLRNLQSVASLADDLKKYEASLGPKASDTTTTPAAAATSPPATTTPAPAATTTPAAATTPAPATTTPAATTAAATTPATTTPAATTAAATTPATTPPAATTTTPATPAPMPAATTTASATTTAPEEVSTLGASTVLYGATALGSLAGFGFGYLGAWFVLGSSPGVFASYLLGTTLGISAGAGLGALAFDGANVGQTALVAGATGLGTMLVSSGVGMFALGDYGGTSSGVFGGVAGGVVLAPIAAVITAHATDAHP